MAILAVERTTEKGVQAVEQQTGSTTKLTIKEELAQFKKEWEATHTSAFSMRGEIRFRDDCSKEPGGVRHLNGRIPC